MEIDPREEVEVDAPVKRRRISIPRNDGQPYLSLFAGAHKRRESNSLKPSAAIDNCDDEKSNISFSATPKQAGQTVAPFLAKHIPAQYPPAGQVESSSADRRTDSNTKYCYRHRPDLKCRRQANEPSMEQLQNVYTLPPRARRHKLNCGTGASRPLTGRPAGHRSYMVHLLRFASQAAESHPAGNSDPMLLSPTLIPLRQRSGAYTPRLPCRTST